MSLKVHTRTPFINTNLWAILAKIHAKTVYMATEVPILSLGAAISSLVQEGTWWKTRQGDRLCSRMNKQDLAIS